MIFVPCALGVAIPPWCFQWTMQVLYIVTFHKLTLGIYPTIFILNEVQKLDPSYIHNLHNLLNMFVFPCGLAIFGTHVSEVELNIKRILFNILRAIRYVGITLSNDGLECGGFESRVVMFAILNVLSWHVIQEKDMSNTWNPIFEIEVFNTQTTIYAWVLIFMLHLKQDVIRLIHVHTWKHHSGRSHPSMFHNHMRQWGI